VTAGRTLSFAEFDHTRDRVAAPLTARGVRPRRTASLFSQNRGEWVVAYHSARDAGAVLNPINVMLTPKDLAFVLRSASRRPCSCAPTSPPPSWS
jgi:long-chain acyl-CoA synthetase